MFNIVSEVARPLYCYSDVTKLMWMTYVHVCSHSRKCQSDLIAKHNVLTWIQGATLWPTQVGSIVISLDHTIFWIPLSGLLVKPTGSCLHNKWCAGEYISTLTTA